MHGRTVSNSSTKQNSKHESADQTNLGRLEEVHARQVDFLALDRDVLQHCTEHEMQYAARRSAYQARQLPSHRTCCKSQFTSEENREIGNPSECISHRQQLERILVVLSSSTSATYCVLACSFACLIMSSNRPAHDPRDWIKVPKRETI